ncbi:hypothetical protein PENSPDRAFT_278752 [Peniophora sp. CONT]|nr:hypothetical protein PENSPDRAFT_278752 [Peniophora sp. CONT]
MPKTPKERWYAVVNGREGTKIYYAKWDDIKHNALGVSHCKYKGCNTKALAEQYIKDTPARVSPMPIIDTATMRTDIAEVPVVQTAAPREIERERVESGDIDTTGQGAGLADAEPSVVLTQPTEDNVNFPEDATPSVALSDEQLRILECVRRGQNVFYTGPAGTGKSILIRAIIRLLSEHRKLAITASTGAASVILPGGRTLYSWAGIGQGTKNVDLLLKDLYSKEKKAARKRWRQTDCLIIDESQSTRVAMRQDDTNRLTQFL